MPSFVRPEHGQADAEDLSGAEMAVRLFRLHQIFVERFHFSC